MGEAGDPCGIPVCTGCISSCWHRRLELSGGGEEVPCPRLDWLGDSELLHGCKEAVAGGLPKAPWTSIKRVDVIYFPLPMVWVRLARHQ